MVKTFNAWLKTIGRPSIGGEATPPTDQLQRLKNIETMLSIEHIDKGDMGEEDDNALSK